MKFPKSRTETATEIFKLKESVDCKIPNGWYIYSDILKIR